MQLPRLVVMIAVCSGIRATLVPDDPPGKPEMKLESNQTAGSRYMGMSSSQYMNPSYGGGMGSNGMGSYGSQYGQSQSQSAAQAQAQSQVMRVSPVQIPYRPGGQYNPYSGDTVPPIVDDGFSAQPTFSGSVGNFAGAVGSRSQGGSMMGGLGLGNLPQTISVVGNIPVTVSGTLNLGVRGSITLTADGGSGSIGEGGYGGLVIGSQQGGLSGLGIGGQGGLSGLGIGGQGSSTYSQYPGSNAGTMSGFSGSSQGMPSSSSFSSFPVSQQLESSARQMAQSQSQSLSSSSLAGASDGAMGRFSSQYQPVSSVSPYGPAISGSYMPVLPLSKYQSGDQAQVPLSGGSGGGAFSQNMGSMMGSMMSPSQSGGYTMQKQMQMGSSGGGQGPRQVQSQNYVRYPDVVSRSLNDEPSEKPET